MPVRLGILSFIGIVVLGLPACKSVPSSRESRAPADARAASPTSAEARAHLEREAIFGKTASDRSVALVTLGRMAVRAGDPRGALKLADDARALSPNWAAISILQGEAHFALGEYAVARRHLVKGFVSAGSAREETLARLSVCAREMGDSTAAAAYRAKLSPSIGGEAARILLSAEARLRDLREEEPLEAHDPASDEVVRVPRQAPSTSRLQVISRADWGPRRVKRNIEPMGAVTRITVHHSGGRQFWGSTRSDSAEEIRIIQRYHQNEQGWADIGYHYVIDRSGLVWQGRSLNYQGAHARGPLNTGNVGIVVLGNFCHQRPTPAQLRSLELIIGKLSRHFAIDPDAVYTHREICGGKTDCPGPALTNGVRAIRDSLKRRLLAMRGVKTPG